MGSHAMQTIDGVRMFQCMVAMRDGVRLNTFVYLPETSNASGPAYPVILQRTPYGITGITNGGKSAADYTDCTRGWLPAADAPMRGSILRGYKAIVARGYAAVYQDTRGRYASGEIGRAHV